MPLVFRQHIRLRQADEPLMTAQLPDDLAVADDIRVERIDAAPMQPRRAMARYRIQMPVQRVAKPKVAVAEEIEAALEETVGLLEDGAAMRLECTSHSDQSCRIGRTRKEAVRQRLAEQRQRRVAVRQFRRPPREERLRRLRPPGDGNPLDPLRRFLPASILDFGEGDVTPQLVLLRRFGRRQARPFLLDTRPPTRRARPPT
jgi:hypothetical protein